jgi:organic hydroperoxide reductase OsmC/OhrA
MPQTTVSIRTLQGATAALGWSNGRSVSIDRPATAGGLGIGFNGGELLLLAVGACYCNDLFREAGKMNLKITSVELQVDANWGGDPVRATDLAFSVKVAGPASKEDIEKLIRLTDQVAEIPNSLRYGTEVTLRSYEAISTEIT